jgi:2-haloacid dehalogenase/putative hydrolase of the HAD superfamily
LRAALLSIDLRCPPSTVAAYQRINHDLWAAFRRGEITQKALARERFSRLLRAVGGDARRAVRLGET